MVRGVELEQIVLGTAQPGQQTGLYKDAVRRLVERLHYLNTANDRFWFDTRPNLRREMEERKRRFNDKEDVFPAIRDRVQKGIVTNTFGGVHVFTRSGDVPDDLAARLVVLSPDCPYSRSGHNKAVEGATEVLKSRGDQPRTKQNRLLFLVADNDSVQRMKDQAKAMLAWQSIVEDIKELKLNLDQFQSRQAAKSLDDAQETLKRMIRETYKWLLAPMQEVKNGKGPSDIQWEPFQINPGTQHFGQEIERALKENELLINEWSPIHLVNLLKTWFWKDGVKEVGALDVWQKTCQYLYLPRLRDEAVFRRTVEAGGGSRDFFGLAYGKDEGKYLGFTFGHPTTQIFDSSLLLIEPQTAKAYADALQAAEAAKAKDGTSIPESGGAGGASSAGEGPPGEGYKPTSGDKATGAALRRHFYGAIELDPVKAKYEFNQIVDEVALLFTQRADTKVRVKVEIEADSTAGFDEGVQRAVKENCNVLKFKNAEFETGA